MAIFWPPKAFTGSPNGWFSLYGLQYIQFTYIVIDNNVRQSYAIARVKNITQSLTKNLASELVVLVWLGVYCVHVVGGHLDNENYQTNGTLKHPQMTGNIKQDPCHLCCGPYISVKELDSKKKAKSRRWLHGKLYVEGELKYLV